MSTEVKECPGCLCPVEPVAKGGRTFVSYENVYPVPDWLEIPTCTVCGARYESEELTKELDYLSRMFDRDLLDKMIEYGNRMEMALILREVVLPELEKLFALRYTEMWEGIPTMRDPVASKTATPAKPTS